MVGDYNVAGGSWSVSATGGTYSVMVFVKTCASTSALPTNPAPHDHLAFPGIWCDRRLSGNHFEEPAGDLIAQLLLVF